MSRIALSLAAAALCAGAASSPAWAQPSDGSVMYRCPGNDYKNTISAKEAEKLGCNRIDSAPLTIIQTTRPQAQSQQRVGTPVPAAPAASGARIDPVAQRARDSDARRILESELKAEEDKLEAMQKEFNSGQPERRGDEKNYQKYIDRVGEMSAAIARKQTDVAAIRRELQKMPPPRSQ
jgi:hypothetical protein